MPLIPLLGGWNRLFKEFWGKIFLRGDILKKTGDSIKYDVPRIILSVLYSTVRLLLIEKTPEMPRADNKARLASSSLETAPSRITRPCFTMM